MGDHPPQPSLRRIRVLRPRLASAVPPPRLRVPKVEASDPDARRTTFDAALDMVTELLAQARKQRETSLKFERASMSVNKGVEMQQVIESLPDENAPHPDAA